MEATQPWTLGILLIYALTTLRAGARPTTTSVSVPVQKPFNLKKESYNFNSTLYWDYNITSIAPYFQVEYRSHQDNNNEWTIVETCRNISHKYCDLSEKIVDPYVHYGARVKAFVGPEVSGNAKTEFYLIDDGIIGPPKLNASVDGNLINIDVWFPHVPHVNGKNNVGDYLDDLTYEIYYGNETEKTNECDLLGCGAQIPLSKDQKTYCFSAQGVSDSVPMTIEKSKEICIDISPPNGISNAVYAVVIPIVLVVIVLLGLCFFIIWKKITSTSKLPGALNTFTTVMTTRLSSGQTTRYDPVTVSPIESPEKNTPEEAEKDLNVSDDSDNKLGIDTGYQSSAGESEQKSDDDQNGKEESSSNNNYYHTENGDCSFVCKKDESTEEEPVRDIKPMTSSFGYDKPHCPL